MKPETEDKIADVLSTQIVNLFIFFEDYVKSLLVMALLGIVTYCAWNWGLDGLLPKITLVQSVTLTALLRLVVGPPVTSYYNPNTIEYDDDGKDEEGSHAHLRLVRKD